MRGHHLERLNAVVRQRHECLPAVRARAHGVGNVVGHHDSLNVLCESPAPWALPAVAVSTCATSTLFGTGGNHPWKRKQELVLQSAQGLGGRSLSRQVGETTHQLRIEVTQSRDQREHRHDELDEPESGPDRTCP